MFGRFFSKSRFGSSKRDVPYEIYGNLVARARNPELYRDLGVPDTINGRFDMMVIHVFLLAHRLKDAGDACRELSQGIFDAFLLDMDRGMREEGVGDTSVPKKLKKMTQVYYGRLRAYEKPLEEGNNSALAEIINRNIFTDKHNNECANALANYMLRLHAHIEALTVEDILNGEIEFDKIEPKSSKIS
jgi:cytochrome b pre-mRNA-processing protein 3